MSVFEFGGKCSCLKGLIDDLGQDWKECGDAQLEQVNWDRVNCAGLDWGALDKVQNIFFTENTKLGKGGGC